MLIRMFTCYLALQHETSGTANVKAASATIVDNWRQLRNGRAGIAAILPLWRLA
jgi:hypothetical protein